MNDSFHKLVTDEIYAFRNVLSVAMPTPLALKYTNSDAYPLRYVICFLTYSIIPSGSYSMLVALVKFLCFYYVDPFRY